MSASDSLARQGAKHELSSFARVNLCRRLLQNLLRKKGETLLTVFLLTAATALMAGATLSLNGKATSLPVSRLAAVSATAQEEDRSGSTSQSAPPSSTLSVAKQIAQDMRGENEGHPHGVPLNYDWAIRPVMSMGNDPTGWKAITAWGSVYEAAEGNPATNTRVNIRNMRTYLLQKSTGKWLLLQNTSKPDGAAYLETFAGNASKPADVRQEPDGTISVRVGAGYNFHFYPHDRASIDPEDLEGIVVVVEARLIVADTSKPDDRKSARYLLDSGADYYPALTGGWPGTADYNPGVALGKLKYVRSEWRSFCMTTLTQSQLERHSPPIDFSGIAP